MQNFSLKFSRFAIFLVYFWFGLLKVLGTSPASPLVLALLDKTMPFMAPDTFLVLFGIFEMIVGALFLFPKFMKLALILLSVHLITTLMPLIMLPKFAWQGFLVPTLEGQYMIKNILIIAIAIGIYVHSSRKN